LSEGALAGGPTPYYLLLTEGVNIYFILLRLRFRFR